MKLFCFLLMASFSFSGTPKVGENNNVNKSIEYKKLCGSWIYSVTVNNNRYVKSINIVTSSGFSTLNTLNMTSGTSTLNQSMSGVSRIAYVEMIGTFGHIRLFDYDDLIWKNVAYDSANTTGIYAIDGACCCGNYYIIVD